MFTTFIYVLVSKKRFLNIAASASLAAASYFGCAQTTENVKKIGSAADLSIVVDEIQQTSLSDAQKITKKFVEEGIPPLDEKMRKILQQISGNPRALQYLLNRDFKYTFDKDQFGASLCEKTPQDCDYWISIGHLFRTGRGDCDDVLALSHYVLNKSGKGIWLLGKNEKGESIAHAVYVYPATNGLWGIINVPFFSYEPAKFKSIEEAAQSLAKGGFTMYREVTITNDENLLFYSISIKPHDEYGPWKDLKPKK